MPILISRAARCALAVMFCWGAGAAQAQNAPARPPLESFFGNAPFSNPVLSPNGKMLAVIVGVPGKRDALAVINLADNHLYPTAHFDDADVRQVHWVNNERLVFDSADKQLAQGERRYGPGMYAVNVDGSDFRELAQRSGEWLVETTGISRRNALPWHTFLMGQEGAQDSDSIYVYSSDYDSSRHYRSMNLLLLNTVTGQAKTVERPGNTQGWVLDNDGKPGAVATEEGGNWTIFYRDRGANEWKKLSNDKLFTGTGKTLDPLAFGAGGTLYVETNNGKDKSAVYAVDLATGKMDGQPIISAPDYDFSGRLVIRNGKLVGFRVTTDARTTMWFDPKLKAMQDEIDKRLPSTINLVSVPQRPETPWVLVESYSDVQPSIVQLFNTETKALNRVGATRPAIKPAEMGPQEVVRYKARDGLMIPALLTLPPGGVRKDLPMVVLVHGGPYVRGDSWGWDPQADFLASRGYAVLQPEYRGSTGFGSAHFRAGWKQWGLGMQNDIADGAKWAVAQGIVDPKRICIAGASYGGYAALMGVLNDPDLFKCAIDWVGVTDIELLYNGSWGNASDVSPEWRKYGMPDLVGDLRKDAAQLKATSPLQQAARIKRPLLLAYGGADTRVPLHHGEKFYEAVKASNPDVEWIVYPEEGHGWALPKNRIDFWGRVEKFLDRNIGK